MFYYLMFFLHVLACSSCISSCRICIAVRTLALLLPYRVPSTSAKPLVESIHHTFVLYYITTYNRIRSSHNRFLSDFAPVFTFQLAWPSAIPPTLDLRWPGLDPNHLQDPLDPHTGARQSC